MKPHDRLRPRYDGAIVATLGGILDRLRARGQAAALEEHEPLDGKRFLVTGANRGLGLAVASRLARRGAHVVLACRSGIPEVVADVRRGSRGRGSLETLQLDLGKLASVQQAVEVLADGRAPFDGVVLNAGIVPREARRTVDGLDESFQVNFLANVLLARRLIERGLCAASARGALPRLVIVSSESHRSAPPIDWAQLGRFRAWKMREAVEQYGAGKLLLQTFSEELARRMRGKLAVHSLCPGAVRTDIGREAPRWAKPALALTMRAFFKAPEAAAVPVVYLASSPVISGESALYFHANRRSQASDDARDEERGRRLWQEAASMLADSGHRLEEAT